jgi:hypothetical protein
MPKQRTDASRSPRPTSALLRLAIWPAILAIYTIVAYRGQSIWMTVGINLLFAALISSLLSYSSTIFGNVVYAVPYIIWLLGALLIVAAPDARDPIAFCLIILGLTVLTHGLVVYDAWKDAP